MKRKLWIYLMMCFLLMIPSAGVCADLISQADALFEAGGMDNYKKCLDLSIQAATAQPNSYEAQWKLARACRYYAYENFKQQTANWEELSKQYGKLGMEHALKAIELEPNKPDGHYYYGVCVGSYADAVSIFTALKEGLKDKTQESFETVYKMDKNYDDCGAILSLGRFWWVLPWPLRDKDLSVKYFEEYKKTPYFGKREEGPLYISEVYIDLDSSKHKDEVKSLLTPLLNSDKKYYKDQAKKLMDQL